MTIEWNNAKSLREFVVADLACGTGTLLMAASQAITDNFIRSSARRGVSVDGASLRELHQVIMEDILHGYDVLPSAVHLTASTLALLAPEISFQKMQLYALPLGKLPDMKIYLGSIEYLHTDRVETQLDLMGEIATQGAAAATTGHGTLPSVAPVPRLDLCVMNPPFVRSVNSNLLFGSLPHWRREMQQELARRLRPNRGRQVLASTTAGLASIFTAIGDRHLKPNGRLALVLPAAITSGGAWAKTRTLIDHGYDLEYLVASHDASRWAFSENTDLSEILLIARKRERSEGRGEDDTTACTFINLWRNPSAIADALSLGRKHWDLAARSGWLPSPPNSRRDKSLHRLREVGRDGTNSLKSAERPAVARLRVRANRVSSIELAFETGVNGPSGVTSRSQTSALPFGPTGRIGA